MLVLLSTDSLSIFKGNIEDSSRRCARLFIAFGSCKRPFSPQFTHVNKDEKKIIQPSYLSLKRE